MTIGAANDAADSGADVVLDYPAPAEPVRDLVDALFRAYAVDLVRRAVLLVGDQATAEDVVQDVFARLQRSSGRRSGRPRPLRWPARTGAPCSPP